MSGLGRRLPRLPRELTALFCVILRQSPRRGCSRTPCTLRLPTGAFPCLTLKYRRQRTGVLSRSASKYRAQRTGGFSLSDAKISPSGNERFYKRCPAETSAGEIVRRSGLRRVIKQLRRGAGDRSARVFIVVCHRCQGRENFSGRAREIFRRNSLTKREFEQAINK